MAYNDKPRYHQLTPKDQNPVVDYFYICIADYPDDTQADKANPKDAGYKNNSANYSWSGTFNSNPTKWRTLLLPLLDPKPADKLITTLNLTDASGKIRTDSTPPKSSSLWTGDDPDAPEDGPVAEPDYKCRTMVFQNSSLTTEYFLVVMVNIPNSPAQKLTLSVDPGDSTNIIASLTVGSSGSTSAPAVGIMKVTNQTIRTVNVASQPAGANTGTFDYSKAVSL
ncbi:MAG TPA: hypothetical protein PLP14_00925 [Chitinophagaceae bacterium]|nr:hypothetical protein [Chitinophagaceae bacterium]